MHSLITDLNVDFLPHRRWAISKWFYSNPLWYYHRPGTDERIVLNRRFYQLVDPDLRDLCRLLNERGLHTTPSCQGHFYLRDRFERIWGELRREQVAIASDGLVVKDSETDQPYLFRRADYCLPWADFDTYYAQAAEHQGTGYLGILLPPEGPPLHDQLCDTAGQGLHYQVESDRRTGARLGGILLHLFVRAPDPAARTAAWGELTRRIGELIAA
jgi:hypothetical protein